MLNHAISHSTDR